MTIEKCSPHFVGELRIAIYKALNVYDSAELRDGIKIYSNWPTIPQLYVKAEFVGGCDIVREMFQAGELQQLFIEKGLPVLQPAN